MKRVLITGATGAFGPAVSSFFEQDRDCLVQKTGRRCGNDDTWTSCDLRDRSQVQQLLAKTRPGLIVHLAGTMDQNYEEAFSVNVQATQMILEILEKNSRHTRVVLIGSASEYGVVRPDENPLSESRCLAPVTAYAMTKAWQTLLMGVFVQRGLDVVVARMFNLDGPGLTDKLFVGRLQKLIIAYKAGEIDRIKLGQLSAVRDYVSFPDAAAQIQAIALHGKAGNIYHVASGVPVTIREVLRRYLEQHGLDESCVQEGLENTNRRGYDVPVIYADISRTEQLLAKPLIL